jgi:hypothetical protein
MTNIIKISPSSFNTLYLRKEDNAILTTESGRKIVIQRFVPEEWKPYRVYEYERDLNENKRSIRMIDRDYIARIEKEIQDKLR